MHPEIPIYISIAFLLAICVPVYLIARLVQKHASPAQSNWLFFGIVAFYVIYLFGVAIASLNGHFDAITLPPKIVQLTTVPLLLLLMVVVFNTSAYKKLLTAIPVDQLVVLHRFRFIGSFFIILWFLQLLPTAFALTAGIGDILTAVSSFWVAKQLKDRKAHSTKLAIIWNSFGLLDILVTSALAILFTKISIDTGAPGVEVLATFPFCFIPAFAPATIIFLHISIYRKLWMKKFR